MLHECGCAGRETNTPIGQKLFLHGFVYVFYGFIKHFHSLDKSKLQFILPWFTISRWVLTIERGSRAHTHKMRTLHLWTFLRSLNVSFFLFSSRCTHYKFKVGEKTIAKLILCALCSLLTPVYLIKCEIPEFSDQSLFQLIAGFYLHAIKRTKRAANNSPVICFYSALCGALLVRISYVHRATWEMVRLICALSLFGRKKKKKLNRISKTRAFSKKKVFFFQNNCMFSICDTFNVMLISD